MTGNCNICRNFEKATKFGASNSRKPKPYNMALKWRLKGTPSSLISRDYLSQTCYRKQHTHTQGSMWGRYLLHKFIQREPEQNLTIGYSCFWFNLLWLKMYFRSRGSSVSIVSDYGLDDRGSIHDRGRGFLCVQTGSGTHPASCLMGTGGPFLGG
jgi:hypothetical protein